MEKPIMLDALKKLPQWVTYKNEVNEKGKPTKVPYQPLQNCQLKADPTNPSDWGTYDDADGAVTLGNYDGLGFVFKKGGCIVGIDLDGWANHVSCVASRSPITPASLCLPIHNHGAPRQGNSVI